MAVAHKPGLLDSAEIFHQRNDESIPAVYLPLTGSGGTNTIRLPVKNLPVKKRNFMPLVEKI